MEPYYGFIYFMGFTPNLEAQVTQPTPQDLPFTQNSSHLMPHQLPI
jgi:hypothetical protein